MTDVRAPSAVAPGVWRVPLTSRTPPPFDHTNSWIVADGGVGWWIDAGFEPDDAAAREAIPAALAAAGVRTLKGVVLTHTHADHVRGLPLLRALHPGVVAYVHPLELARVPGDGPVRALQGERRLVAGDLVVTSIHTPGHAPGHLALWIEPVRVAIVGDLLAADSSVFVGWPDGDVAAYLRSLDAIATRAPYALAPGHGPPVVGAEAALARIAAVAAHRRAREREVMDALARAGTATPAQLLGTVYPDLDPSLEALALRSLRAHLEKLRAEGRAELAEGSDANADEPRLRLVD